MSGTNVLLMPKGAARTKKVEIVIPVSEEETAAAEFIEGYFESATILLSQIKEATTYFEQVIQSAQKTEISMSEAEAAKVLGIEERTLQLIRREGKISYTPVGRNAHYTSEHLRNYIVANQKLCAADRRKK